MIDRVRELEEEIANLKFENEKLKLELMDNNRSTKNYIESSVVSLNNEDISCNFKDVFDNNLSVMLVIDPYDGRIIDANRAALKFYGYSKDDITEMKISEINILPYEEVLSEMKRAVENDRNIFYFRHRLLNGDIRDVAVTSDPIVLKGKNLLFSIIVDITEKNKQSKILSESEKKFKHMFNNISDMILVFKLNDDGTPSNFIEVNEEACSKLGYSYEALRQLSPIDIEKNNSNKVKSLVHKLYSNNLRNYETSFVTNKKKAIPVEISTHSFDLFGDRNILVVARDISKRKEIEFGLKNSIKQQQKLLSSLPAAIFIVDKNKILSVNEYGKNLLGYNSCDELLGKDYLQIVVHPDYHEKVKARHKITMIDAPLIEEKYIKKNGEVVDVEVTALKIPYENGSALLIFATNITEWKNIQNKLVEISQVEKLRTEFFANISHELRTPLNVILGSLQLQEFYLNKESMGRNTEKYKKIHERTKRNCYRLLRLVNNLIDMTKIDSGFYEVDFQDYDIVHLIRTIVKSMEDYVKKQNLVIKFHSNIESLLIACDPEKFERIMLNLLSNAIKFTEPKGLIKVTINKVDEELLISVKDSGIGIPKEKQDVIFDRFVQVDKSLTRKHEGSGIGLSLVKALVEMHQGSICVKSATKKGSEFIIKLPVRRVIKNEEENKMIWYDSFNIERMHIEFSDIYSK